MSLLCFHKLGIASIFARYQLVLLKILKLVSDIYQMVFLISLTLEQQEKVVSSMRHSPAYTFFLHFLFIRFIHIHFLCILFIYLFTFYLPYCP